MAETARHSSKAEMKKAERLRRGFVAQPDGRLTTKSGQLSTQAYSPKIMKTLSKQKKFNETVERICGQDGERIVKKLLEIALYDPDMPIYNSEKQKVEKRKHHFYSSNDQLKALQIVASYYFGKPVETKQIESNQTINIEKRVANITKLISESKDKGDVIDISPEE